MERGGGSGPGGHTIIGAGGGRRQMILRAPGEVAATRRCKGMRRATRFPEQERVPSGCAPDRSTPRGLMRRFLAIVALATLVACDSFDPLVENTVNGTWRGTSANQTFVLVMQQATSGAVAGNGTIASGSTTRNLSISGTFQQPAFSATFTPNGAAAITYMATMEGRTMVGTLTGGGFNGEGLALQRDP